MGNAATLAATIVLFIAIYALKKLQEQDYKEYLDYVHADLVTIEKLDKKEDINAYIAEKHEEAARLLGMRTEHIRQEIKKAKTEEEKLMIRKKKSELAKEMHFLDKWDKKLYRQSGYIPGIDS